MREVRTIGLFAVGGVIGLVVDAGISQALVSFGHWNAYVARIVSFLAAAVVTWWWNRRHTFAGRSSGRAAHAELLHWLALMSVGALVNYGIFAACLMLFPVLHRWPAVAVAAGSAVAALVNFSTARGLLYRHPKAAR